MPKKSNERRLALLKIKREPWLYDWWYCPVCAAVYYNGKGSSCHVKLAHWHKPRLKLLKPPEAVAAAYALGGREALRAMAHPLASNPIPLSVDVKT